MANDTELKILEIARKHFVQKGFAGARMQEIADEAGINKAMLHYYFRNKNKLYEGIIIETLNILVPRFAKAFEYQGTVIERIEKIVETYIDTLVAHPDIPFFILSELSQRRERFVEELKKRSAYFPAIQSFIMQLMQDMNEGKIREVPPIQLLLNVVSMTVFPFVAKPIFSVILDVSDKNFDDLMLERKKVVVEFVKNALKVD